MEGSSRGFFQGSLRGSFHGSSLRLTLLYNARINQEEGKEADLHDEKRSSSQNTFHGGRLVEFFYISVHVGLRIVQLTSGGPHFFKIEGGE